MSTILVHHLNMHSGEKVVALESCADRCVHPEKVEMVRRAALSQEALTRSAALFKLLGDPTRARLLYALLEAGELCVCDLAAATDQQETTVSQSLRMLRASGVVTGRRQGRLVYYRLADSHVRMLLDLTREHVGHEQSATAPTAPTAPTRRSVADAGPAKSLAPSEGAHR